MSQDTVKSILFNFSQLFILCKIFGIYPYNLKIFHQYGELKKSTFGTIFVIFSMITIIILYNLLIFSFSEEGNTWKPSQRTLTFVIGIFLTYIGLIMMCTDQITAILNQNRLSKLYSRIRVVDERLFREGCCIDNTKVRQHINIMLLFVFICEISIMLLSYIVLIEQNNWKSLLWVFSILPTLFNSLDKIWFAATLKALQQRFSVINKALKNMVKEHESYKITSSNYENSKQKRDSSKNVRGENLFFLYTEFHGAADIVRYNRGKNKIIPVAAVMPSFNNFNTLFAEKNDRSKIIYESQLNDVIKVEEKLNNFCQLHDELCEIGKMLNELWSYPILVLMAYGFLIFTAQLYFLYCATQGQDIPSLFLSAKSAVITALLLIYTAGKCIYIIYLSWKTSLESKFTGICLHKCGIVADNTDLYEIINHLSLKLLNHTVDFTACGFFSLDMETLYGISGGITSYLIILIQFNLAAQQAKEGISSYSLNRTSDRDGSYPLLNTTSLFGNINTTNEI